MDKKRSRRIISLLRRHHGSPSPDLMYENIYQLTIAVVLSAQTTDIQVNGVTPALFGRYPDFPSLAMARIGDVEKIIKSTGFYHHKARHIVALSKIVADDWDNSLPGDRESLMTLPGVGRKSANVILAVGMNIPAMPVDTHVLRISNRLGYVTTEDPRAAEEALTAVIPPEEWIDVHLIFIRHGRSICLARSPRCGACPVSDLCPGRIVTA